MLTRNQKFALAVYDKVENLKIEMEKEIKSDKDRKSFIDKFDTIAKKIPMLVRTAGLAQTIGYLQAKSVEKKIASESKFSSDAKIHRQFLTDLADVVSKSSAGEFAEECRNASINNYLILTQNTLAALLWFKRYSESVLGGNNND